MSDVGELQQKGLMACLEEIDRLNKQLDKAVGLLAVAEFPASVISKERDRWLKDYYHGGYEFEDAEKPEQLKEDH